MNPLVHLLSNRIFPVAIRPGVTPVTIPNTMVKTWEADDTMLETAWESRWLPGSLKKRLGNRKAYKIEQASGRDKDVRPRRTAFALSSKVPR